MGTGNNINSNLISIIVPIYNGGDYIDRCVGSILKQTYTEWELLLMDGASSDDSPQLCDEWQRRDKRIRAFHSERNRGVSEGRNMGLREASGAYIMFVDVDDWLLPDCLQRLYDDIQKPGVQIAGCGFISCTDEDRKEQLSDIKTATMSGVDASRNEYRNKPNVRLIAGKDFLREGILKRDTRCWSKLYKRELIEGHFFNEAYTIGEDMLFVWETAREAELISSSDYKGYCYYRNVNGAMLKRFRESDIDQIRCWQFLLQSLFAENGKEEKYDTDVIIATATNLLISCMLVAGKLAMLPGEERRQYADINKQCRDVLKETLRIKGAYAGLDKSYRIKVSLYKLFSDLYLNLYHILKR
ncbi:MAG: glycosyltransferase family 2 protein [Lachnospiraceae bacterium]|nr:glycosyltransferase family 2 protein [Lachnospiraceae bacterium]